MFNLFDDVILPSVGITNPEIWIAYKFARSQVIRHHAASHDEFAKKYTPDADTSVEDEHRTAAEDSADDKIRNAAEDALRKASYLDDVRRLKKAGKLQRKMIDALEAVNG